MAFPGPFLSSLVAADAARRLGLDDLAVAARARRASGTVALEESGHGDPVDARPDAGPPLGRRVDAHRREAARARRPGRRRGCSWSRGRPTVWRRSGSTRPTWSRCRASTAAGASGAWCCTTRRRCRSGRRGDHTAVWRAVADDTAVALAAELTGVCDASIAMAMDYAEQRVQFDRPIASHQVIQHKLVDMLHATELGRVGVHYAAWASDTDDPDAGRAASIAKAQMGEAAVMVTGENIQVHGAVGFTWESRRRRALPAGQAERRARRRPVVAPPARRRPRARRRLMVPDRTEGDDESTRRRARARARRRRAAPRGRAHPLERRGRARWSGSGGTATRGSRS